MFKVLGLIWWNFLIYSFLKGTHLALKRTRFKAKHLNNCPELSQLLPSPADTAWNLAEPYTRIM